MGLQQWFIKVLTELGQILGLIQQLNSGPTDVSRETSPYSTQNAAQAAQTLLNDPTYGLNAILGAMDAQFSTIGGLLDTLSAAVANIPTTGTPVTLPTTPPTGYGGGAGASEVWNYALGLGAIAAGDLMIAAGDLAIYAGAGLVSWPTSYPGGWSVSGDWPGPAQTEPNVNYPVQFDPSTILSTDATLPDWLDRAYPGHGSTYAFGGYPQQAQTPSQWVWTFYMGDVEFAEYKAAKFGASAVITNVPPVWPGAANITSAGMQDITASTEWDGPCDGVIIGLFSVPANLPHYTYGTTTAYGHLGAIAFVDDNGQAEAFQPIQFNDQVICPKTMVRASAVVWRVTPGLTGGITPWTINT